MMNVEYIMWRVCAEHPRVGMGKRGDEERRNKEKSEGSYSIVYTVEQRLIASETIERKKRE